MRFLTERASAMLFRGACAAFLSGACAAFLGALGAAASAAPPQRVGLNACAGLCTYKLLYTFQSPSGPHFPGAGVIDLNGVLYGTTDYGGLYNMGAVFALDTTGRERTVYSFKGGTDGAVPAASLVAVNGVLYGTTSEGGTGHCQQGCGVVFSLTTSGIEKVLHRFGVGSDGASPLAPLVVADHALYGTTAAGGKYGAGTVFRVDCVGTEALVYSFTGGADGGYPQAGEGLIALNGVLYGTTANGGIAGCVASGNGGCGTVFAVTRSGSERVLHRFGGYPDGASPVGSLLYLNGELYGTTSGGGTSGCLDGTNPYGCGTVFAVTPSGVERVLYRFQEPGAPASDGALPSAGLTNVNGVLYGTTGAGGGYNVPACYNYQSEIDPGCGTVFSVTTSGVERTVHAFGTLPEDGLGSAGPLLDVNGSLYGTSGGTELHGAFNGFGTVFVVSP